MKQGLDMRPRGGLVPVCVLLFLHVALAGCATVGRPEGAVLRARERVSPALVHIRPVKEVFQTGKRTEMLAVGSGFIISPDGYVVTNEHVAGDSTSVQCVLSDNRELDAQVVGTDPDTDIAVLKLQGEGPFPFVNWGQSGSIESGQVALAFGSPHGLSRSVSMGIVSMTDRNLDEEGASPAPYNNFIQTDAAINPGNSGGPLVNIRGEVIGVNARMLRGAENVGFAIPADIARAVVDAIIREGRVRRSYFGFELQEMTARSMDPGRQGVLIAGVDRFSPAAEADIRPGDVLVAVNGKPVNARWREDLPAVRRLIAELPVGDPARLTINRNGEQREVTVTSVEKTDARGKQEAFELWGLSVAEVTQEVARRAQLSKPTGVLVIGVSPGAPAGWAGLQPGDIILTMDGETVEDFNAFKRLYDQRLQDNRRQVMLFVQRGALTRFVLVNLEQASTEQEDTRGHE
ncbi:MAG: trypsin-like peptidase domain-containing protein [Candidatus Hydrogenedentes bacterium]|nr:trypsin-like peptidase domain-containing protein [Candidatus Hydrogenedentota bacterium]